MELKRRKRPTALPVCHVERACSEAQRVPTAQMTLPTATIRWQAIEANTQSALLSISLARNVLCGWTASAEGTFQLAGLHASTMLMSALCQRLRARRAAANEARGVSTRTTGGTAVAVRERASSPSTTRSASLPHNGSHRGSIGGRISRNELLSQVQGGVTDAVIYGSALNLAENMLGPGAGTAMAEVRLPTILRVVSVASSSAPSAVPRPYPTLAPGTSAVRLSNLLRLA